ncbi:MAG TPA: hypothetical protein VGR63_16730 [Casimicrobiaceae bacterium]|jgi:hypothetical protein|nr:hypothetical protein [Casimicrobiaceae bacterium]
MHRRFVTSTIFAALALAASAASGQAPDMSFFVTSTNGGKGADYGGLAGADKHCQALATAAGAGKRTWHAYLSASAMNGQSAVNARDRIGKGPWKNAKGVVVASDVAQLHGENNLNKQTALTEKGTVVNGRGDTPNEHDILTGSQPDGTAFADSSDHTCGNWTKGGTDGSAMLGHVDRQGTNAPPASMSWNSSHPSKGCDSAGLKSTGGNGYLYCFAAD